MSGRTKIQWTQNSDGTQGRTWNPTVGCTRVSQGCKNCYAFSLHDMRHAAHQRGAKLPAQYAKPFTELQIMEDRLTDPLHWRKPCRVFVNSVSDLFHEDVPDEFIDRVFAVMGICKHHAFQILTKRAERMVAYTRQVIDDDKDLQRFANWAAELTKSPCAPGIFDGLDYPFNNVWLGVSVENQECADRRIPLLLQTPAAVRFLSCEPLLGPVDLSRWAYDFEVSHNDDGTDAGSGSGGSDIDWVIIGGESGNHARPCQVEWVRSIVQQCRGAGTACFVKQLGSNIETDGTQTAGNWWPDQSQMDDTGDGTFRKHLNDGHGGDPEEWPTDLRVRDFPR